VLGLLHQADVLRCDVPPDTAALFRRVEEREGKERRSKLNPISFRVPLLDPDAFLTRWERFARPFFTRRGAMAWCALIGVAGFLALKNAPELAAGARSLFEPASLVALWFAYPVVKTLHELGHAFAVKRWRARCTRSACSSWSSCRSPMWTPRHLRSSRRSVGGWPLRAPALRSSWRSPRWPSWSG
jgi:hypothetical protein